MFIFSLINIPADHKKKKTKTNKQTSDKYTHFQKNCTFISVISENYNQQSRSLHLIKLQSAKSFSTSVVIYVSEDHDRPCQGKNHKKEKDKRMEKEKRWEERNNGRSGT